MIRKEIKSAKEELNLAKEDNQGKIQNRYRVWTKRLPQNCGSKLSPNKLSQRAKLCSIKKIN